MGVRVDLRGIVPIIARIVDGERVSNVSSVAEIAIDAAAALAHDAASHPAAYPSLDRLQGILRDLNGNPIAAHAQPSAGALAGQGAPSTMLGLSITQDFAIVEAILSDVATFSSGQPIAVPPVRVGAYELSVTATKVASQTAPLGGSFLQLLGQVFQASLELTAGAPYHLRFTEKIGNTYIEYAVSVAKAA